MRIQHHITGMRALRYGKKLNSNTAKTPEKLSSGYCINRAQTVVQAAQTHTVQQPQSVIEADTINRFSD